MHCFIQDNSYDLRLNLKLIGIPYNTLGDNHREWLAVNYGRAISVSPGFGKIKGDGLDCGKNRLLFLAVAALKEDSDEHQWFVSDELPKRYIICRYKHFSDYGLRTSYHKMSLDELREYFKMD